MYIIFQVSIKICERDDSNNLAMNRKHEYYYQIQGQMLITGVETCYLVGYTHKGITAVKVHIDKEFCDTMIDKLTGFYKDAFFPLIKAVGHSNC